jgi:hypothetical protein
MLAAASLLPLEAKNEKRPRKSPRPFQEEMLQQLYPHRSYLSPALLPLKTED